MLIAGEAIDIINGGEKCSLKMVSRIRAWI